METKIFTRKIYTRRVDFEPHFSIVNDLIRKNADDKIEGDLLLKKCDGTKYVMHLNDVILYVKRNYKIDGNEDLVYLTYKTIKNDIYEISILVSETKTDNGDQYIIGTYIDIKISKSEIMPDRIYDSVLIVSAQRDEDESWDHDFINYPEVNLLYRSKCEFCDYSLSIIAPETYYMNERGIILYYDKNRYIYISDEKTFYLPDEVKEMIKRW